MRCVDEHSACGDCGFASDGNVWAYVAGEGASQFSQRHQAIHFLCVLQLDLNRYVCV